MKLLGIELSSAVGSIALLADGDISERTIQTPREQTARTLACVDELLGAAGLALRELDGVTFGRGPGSFTGLRVGIATMQGLALATGRPLLGVSALDALAHVAASGAPGGEHVIGAWIDAWRGEVYAARFSADGTPDGDPIVAPPAAALAQVGGDRVLLVGDGVAAHRDAVTALAPEARLADPLAPPLAPAVAELAARAVAGGARPAPHAIRPIYVRRPDAELARDARA
jgi:tRNA threonylcarbamoyladenosine biosynthesis protein TsaB